MRHSLFAAAALALTLSAGCVSLGSASIADIQQRPGRYHDRSVNIDGVVTSSWGLPLIPYRFYKVDDGTGEVTVLSQSSRMPARGERVKVRGKVNEVAILGGRPLGLHLREEKLSVRR